MKTAKHPCWGCPRKKGVPIWTLLMASNTQPGYAKQVPGCTPGNFPGNGQLSLSLHWLCFCFFPFYWSNTAQPAGFFCVCVVFGHPMPVGLLAETPKPGPGGLQRNRALQLGPFRGAQRCSALGGAGQGEVSFAATGFGRGFLLHASTSDQTKNTEGGPRPPPQKRRTKNQRTP